MFSHINDVINNSAKVSLGGGRERAANAEAFRSGSLTPELSCYFLLRPSLFPLPRNLLAPSLQHGLQPALCKMDMHKVKGQAVGQEESRAQEQEGAGLFLCVHTRPELPRLSSSDSGLRLPLEWPCKGAGNETQYRGAYSWSRTSPPRIPPLGTLVLCFPVSC